MFADVRGETSKKGGVTAGDPAEGSRLTGLKETCLHTWGNCLEIRHRFSSSSLVPATGAESCTTSPVEDRRGTHVVPQLTCTLTDPKVPPTELKPIDRLSNESTPSSLSMQTNLNGPWWLLGRQHYQEYPFSFFGAEELGGAPLMS